jgi:hypothetical protein
MAGNKLLLGTNTFGDNIRQTISRDSWIYLKEQNPEVLDLITVQFENEKDQKFDLPAVFTLTRSSKTEIKSSIKTLPFFWDILYSIYLEAEKREDTTHFGFINSDCILTGAFIQYFQNMKEPALAVSRNDIAETSSFEELKRKGAMTLRCEIAGFDLFIFDKKWFFRQLRSLMRGDYLLGVPVFDVIYAGLIKILGGEIYNDPQKPLICHVYHENSSHNETPEKKHNEAVMKKSLLDHLVMNVMFYHLQYNLCHRSPWGRFIEIPEKEKDYTKRFFDAMRVDIDNHITYIASEE